jgi:hypothetical protein
MANGQEELCRNCKRPRVVGLSACPNCGVLYEDAATVLPGNPDAATVLPPTGTGPGGSQPNGMMASSTEPTVPPPPQMTPPPPPPPPDSFTLYPPMGPGNSQPNSWGGPPPPQYSQTYPVSPPPWTWVHSHCTPRHAAVRPS